MFTALGGCYPGGLCWNPRKHSPFSQHGVSIDTAWIWFSQWVMCFSLLKRVGLMLELECPRGRAHHLHSTCNIIRVWEFSCISHSTFKLKQKCTMFLVFGGFQNGPFCYNRMELGVDELILVLLPLKTWLVVGRGCAINCLQCESI